MLAGLYIHVPFCARVCPYCDFAVRTGNERKRREFVAGVCREIEIVAAEGFAGVVEFDTMYFGGGTPSSMAAEQLGEILEHARRWLPVRKNAWITIEANPEDVDEARARAWRALGVGTVSIGVQSLVDEQLEYLGREHRAEQAAVAVTVARAYGFPIVSIDLMFGVERQTPTSWRAELRAAVALEPEHVSCYQLTFHEGTPFWRWRQEGRRAEMAESDQADLYLLAYEELGAAGYNAYEVSNFAAAEEFQSRHNSKYWRHLPYLGLGPSAHSFDGQRHRWWNHRDLPEYLAALDTNESPVAGSETLTDAELVPEAVMFGMHAQVGIDLDGIRQRWGVDLRDLNAERFARWAQDGLIRGTDVLVPTARGMAIADRLAADVLTTADRAG